MTLPGPPLPAGLAWEPLLPPPALVLAAVVGVALLGLGWLATAGRPLAVRLPSLVARVAAVALLAILVLRPVTRTAGVTFSRDRVALLVDGSASMALASGEGDRPRARVAADRVARALRDRPAWARSRDLEGYRYDVDLARAPLEPLGQAGPVAGAGTRLLESLEALRRRHVGRNLAGVVVVSDGRDTGLLHAGLTGPLRARLRGLDLPVNVVPIGAPALRDAAVMDVQPDDVAFVRQVARIRVVAEVVGAPDETLVVDLYREGKLDKTLDLPGPGPRREATFEVTADRAGELVGEVRIRPLAGEVTEANNRRHFVMPVVRDRLRVLQIAGAPSWDVRFLRQHLKRDPNVDLISFFILRTHRNPTMAAQHEMSLIEFPTEALFTTHLASFDLVILQNFERYPPEVGRYLDNLVGYLRQGGGVAVVGGPRTLSQGGFHGSALAEVLPVELLPPAASDRMVSEEAFRPRLGAAAAEHPITRPDGDTGLTDARLARLPALEGLNRVARPHADAAVLATHPLVTDADGRPHPVIATREVDQGRILAVLTDATWRWRFSEAEGGVAAYDGFWRHAFAYLVRDPGTSRLRVSVPRTPRGAAEAVVATLQAFGPDFRPAAGVSVEHRLVRLDAPGLPVRHTGRVTTPATGLVQVTLPPGPAGAYRLEARATLGGRPVEAHATYVTRASGEELVRLVPDPRLLADVAAATGGAVLGPGDWSAARLHAPRRLALHGLRTAPVLGSPWVLWLLLALSLALDWGIRRRALLP